MHINFLLSWHVYHSLQQQLPVSPNLSIAHTTKTPTVTDYSLVPEDATSLNTKNLSIYGQSFITQGLCCKRNEHLIIA